VDWGMGLWRGEWDCRLGMGMWTGNGTVERGNGTVDWGWVCGLGMGLWNGEWNCGLGVRNGTVDWE
jgi:hypothetical protein